MITRHLITTGHVFESDKGGELYIEVQHPQNTASVSYRNADKERIVINLPADGIEDFKDMLVEAVQLMKGVTG